MLPTLAGDPARRFREARQRAGYLTTSIIDLVAVRRHGPLVAT